MRRFLLLLNSTVGLKVIVALTGAGLIAFLVVHMLGNLQMFAGPAAINGYAVKLKGTGALLWVARAGLLILLVIHVTATVWLWFRNRATPAARYAMQQHEASTWASRTMIISGLVVAAFVVFHLLHFTLGVIQPDAAHLIDSAGRHDVYSMVIYGFRNWAIAGLYVVALVLVGLHLSHAAFSVICTLGLRLSGTEARVKWGAQVFAVIVAVGFVAIPAAVTLHVLRMPPPQAVEPRRDEVKVQTVDGAPMPPPCREES